MSILKVFVQRNASDVEQNGCFVLELIWKIVQQRENGLGSCEKLEILIKYIACVYIDTFT